MPLHNRVGMALLATHHKTSRRESLTFSSFTKHPNPWLMTEHYVALKLQFNATDNASDLNQPIHLVLWILPTMWVSTSLLDVLLKSISRWKDGGWCFLVMADKPLTFSKPVSRFA